MKLFTCPGLLVIRFGIILRFRGRKFLFAADTEAMHVQVSVRPARFANFSASSGAKTNPISSINSVSYFEPNALHHWYLVTLQSCAKDHSTDYPKYNAWFMTTPTGMIFPFPPTLTGSPVKRRFQSDRTNQQPPRKIVRSSHRASHRITRGTPP